jgi:hypothetical protein
MMLLKIEDNKVFFRTDKDKDFASLDVISKDDILSIFKKIFLAKEDEKLDDFADEFNKDLIGNDAHKIIYERLYKKIKELWENRSTIIDEIKNEFKAAEEKYITKKL